MLRISSELDIVGDVTATVHSPGGPAPWAQTPPEPRAACHTHAGNRYLQVTAAQITATASAGESSRARL